MLLRYWTSTTKLRRASSGRALKQSLLSPVLVRYLVPSFRPVEASPGNAHADRCLTLGRQGAGYRVPMALEKTPQPMPSQLHSTAVLGSARVAPRELCLCFRHLNAARLPRPAPQYSRHYQSVRGDPPLVELSAQGLIETPSDDASRFGCPAPEGDRSAAQVRRSLPLQRREGE